MQDDIAQSVVNELRSALLGDERDSSASAAVTAEVQAAAKGRAANAEAYRLYLQGRFLVARRTREDTAKGAEYLRRATELDPEYALAWAELATAQGVEAFTGWIERAEGFSRVREAAARALALEPDLAGTRGARERSHASRLGLAGCGSLVATGAGVGAGERRGRAHGGVDSGESWSPG